jgi:hypothetical protein
MKHISIILLSLLLGYQQINAQDSTKINTFREKLMPQYIIYFNRAKLTEKGLLDLYATDKYIQLSGTDKKSIMTNITASWREPLVIVQCGEKTELWGWNGETGITDMIDEWYLKPSLNKYQSGKTSTIKPHLPWFFYVGDLMRISKGNEDMSLNSRVGCFMFDNKWDFAATFSVGFNSSGEGENVSTTNKMSYGIMGRKRFIIPNNKLKFTPSIGGQLLNSSDGGTSTTTAAVIFGISWYVGIGSIDLDFSIGKQTSGMGGYTIAPNMMRR